MNDLKPIPDCAGYFANRDGNIYSTRSSRASLYKLTPGINKRGKGYAYVNIHTGSKRGTAKTITVHRLISATFIPNPLNKPEVNHKNGNPRDNRADNLEWCTHAENVTHANRELPRNKRSSKLTADQISRIKALFRYGLSGVRISQLTKISRGNLSSIKNGKIWKHVA